MNPFNVERREREEGCQMKAYICTEKAAAWESESEEDGPAEPKKEYQTQIPGRGKVGQSDYPVVFIC